MILLFIYIHKVPRGVLKTSACCALGFQHFPRDHANVNEWEIIFDPTIITYACFYSICMAVIQNLYYKNVYMRYEAAMFPISP